MNYILAPCLAILLSPSMIMGQNAFRDKIGIGITGGYKGELNTGGPYIEWEPFRNVKLSVGAGFSGVLPSGYGGSIKYLLHQINFIKVAADPQDDQFLSPIIGLSYFRIPQSKLETERLNSYSDYQFSSAEYIIPSIGIGGGEMNYKSWDRWMGTSIYLSICYQLRLNPEELILTHGPPDDDYKSKVERRAGDGLGISLTLLFHLQFHRNHKN